MIEEDKIKAIPNILKLSKYKYVFQDLFDIFADEELKQFSYVQEKQYMEIEEDKIEHDEVELVMSNEEQIYI